ncbi:MAG: TonB family protein [Gemmatimonadota bacterium]|nr:MAG: TonB family protein [Gemmatimonadota bacterium]
MRRPDEPWAFLSLVLCVCAAACGHAPPTYDVPPILANREEVSEVLESLGAVLEAQVVLLIEVDEEGVPRQVRVAEGSGDRHLDALAVLAGRQMRFRPARYQGRPVSAWVQMPVSFELPPPVVQPPTLLNGDAVAQMMADLHADLRGSVRLRILLSPLGIVDDVRAREGSDPEVREAALGLVPRLRFAPAMAEGRPTEARLVVLFTFAGPTSEVIIEPSEEGD